MFKRLAASASLPAALCLAALFVVWLLIDIQDNISEFLDSKNTVLTILKFYFTRSSAA